MKLLRLLTTLALTLTLLPIALIAAELSYQGVITDSNGLQVADGSYNFTFVLYTQPTSGTIVWAESEQISISDIRQYLVCRIGKY